MSKNKIIESALFMGLVQLMNLGLPLLSLPYLANTLGVEQLGRMAFALSAAQILVILTDYGFNLSAPKMVAIHRDNPQKICELWSTITTIKAMLAIAGLIIVCASTLISERVRNEFWLFAAAYVMVIGNVLFPQWLFQGLQTMKTVSFLQIAGRITAFSFIFLLVKSEADVYWATFLQASGLLVGGLISLPHTLGMLKNGNLIFPDKKNIKNQLIEGWHVFLSTAAINFYTTSNTFFLGLITNSTAVGHFHVAEKLIRAVQALYSPISNAIFPHISHLAAKSPNEALKFIGKLLFKLVFISFSFSIFIFFIAPYAIEIVVGKGYEPAGEILQILSLMLPFSIIANMLAIQTMIPFGMESKLSRILFATAVFNFSVFIPASYLYEGYGAAYANLIVEIFIATLSFFCLKKGNIKIPLI